MAKKITARVGSYTNQQGENKGRFVEIGALGMSQGGKEYVLINPTVDLGGVLQLQNIEAAKEGKDPSDRIICSVFDNDNQPQGGYGQQQQNHNQQGGYQQQQRHRQAPPQNQPPAANNFDDDIQF
jgi:hypothetical protein